MRKTDFPPISFCMTVYNDRINIKKCLNSLLSLNYPKNKMEIIIHDSKSTDGTEKILEEYRRKHKKLIKIISKKLNRSQGRNIALKNAKLSKEFIAIVNSDAILDKNWLKNALKIIKLDEKIAVVASNQLHPKEIFEKLIWWIPGMAEISFASTPTIYKRKYIEVKNAPCEAAFYRKRVLFGVKLFNEKINWGEDPELSNRIRKAGYKIVANKDVKIKHKYKSGMKRFIKQQFMYGYGGAKLKREFKSTYKESIAIYKRIGIYFFPIYCLLFLISMFFSINLFFWLLVLGFVFLLVLYGNQSIRAALLEKNILYFFALLGLLGLKTVCNALGFIYGVISKKNR